MTDEEFLFHKDCADKKRTVLGVHHKVTHGGRVMMPSDYLTKKEIEAMNSDVTTYKIGEPRTWIEFLQMPDSMKLEYLNYIYSKYNASLGMLSRMFDVKVPTISMAFKRMGLPVSGCNRKRTAEELAAWERFLGPKMSVLDKKPSGNPDPVGEPREPGVVEAPKVIEVHKVSPVDPKTGAVTFEGSVEDVLIAIRRVFAGNPNLRMRVTWEAQDKGTWQD